MIGTNGLLLLQRYWKLTYPTDTLYSNDEIDLMIIDGFIPIANNDELYSISSTTPRIMGKDSNWQNIYTPGPDKKYVLVSNIDAEGAADNIWAPVSNFTGIVDGNNLNLINVYLDHPSDGVGMFQSINYSNSIIRNLNITAENHSTAKEVSILGPNKIDCLIENCTINGTINNQSIIASRHGAIGWNSGTIRSCTINVDIILNIKCTEIGILTGVNYSTGLIENCIVSGSCTGPTGTTSAGIVGFNAAGTIKNNYSIATTTHGICVRDTPGINIGNYYNTDIVISSPAGGGIGKTTQELQSGSIGSIDIYTDWSSQIWHAGLTTEYPQLICDIQKFVNEDHRYILNTAKTILLDEIGNNDIPIVSGTIYGALLAPDTILDLSAFGTIYDKSYYYGNSEFLDDGITPKPENYNYPFDYYDINRTCDWKVSELLPRSINEQSLIEPFNKLFANGIFSNGIFQGIINLLIFDESQTDETKLQNINTYIGLIDKAGSFTSDSPMCFIDSKKINHPLVEFSFIFHKNLISRYEWFVEYGDDEMADRSFQIGITYIDPTYIIWILINNSITNYTLSLPVGLTEGMKVDASIFYDGNILSVTANDESISSVIGDVGELRPINKKWIGSHGWYGNSDCNAIVSHMKISDYLTGEIDIELNDVYNGYDIQYDRYADVISSNIEKVELFKNEVNFNDKKDYSLSFETNHRYTIDNNHIDGILIDKIGNKNIPIVNGGMVDGVLTPDTILDLSAFGTVYDKSYYYGNSEFLEDGITPKSENWNYPYDYFNINRTCDWKVSELYYHKIRTQYIAGELSTLYAKLIYDGDTLLGLSDLLIYDNAVVDPTEMLNHIGVPPELEFIITVKTDNVGTTNDNQFYLPIIGTNFTVETSEQTLTGLSSEPTLTWSVPGTYQVKVRGTYDQIYFNDSFDKLKITYIDQWGTTAWTNMSSAFQGCANLVGCDSVAPNLFNVITLRSMFRYATIFNGDLSNWDVSNIENMDTLFYDCILFNSDLSDWNVSNVTNMYYTFAKCYVFNSDLSNWDVSNVTNMTLMFWNAQLFNSDISNWNVSNVNTMYGMFNGALIFNQDLSAWNVSNVTNMKKMFYSTSFNQDISNWNVSNVTDFSDFATGTIFSRDNYDAILVAWALLDLVDDLAIDFGNSTYSTIGQTAKNSIIADDNWTFSDGGVAADFVITVKTDNVGTTNDNQFYLPIVGTDFTVETSEQILTGLSTAPTLEWSVPGTYQVKVSGDYHKIYFNNEFDKSKLTYINQWGIKQWAIIERAFYGCNNLTGCDSVAPDLSNVTNVYKTFGDCDLFNGDVSNWDVSNVTNMNRMFIGCFVFNQDLSNWDVSNVVDMQYMFLNCYTFNQNLSAWDVSNVTNMNAMFFSCFTFDQDLSNWDVSNVTNFISFAASSTFSRDNYDAILVAWSQLDLVDDLSIHFGNSTYSTIGQTAKNSIIADDNWTFVDGGLAHVEYLGETYYYQMAFVDNNTTYSNIRALDINDNVCLVDWGNGVLQEADSTATNSNIIPNGNTITIYAKASLKLFNSTVNKFHYDIANLPNTVTYYYDIGDNTVYGDIINLPSTLGVFVVYGDNTITGNIANIPSTVNNMWLYGNNTIYGDITDAIIPKFIVRGYNTLHGDLSHFNNVMQINIYGNNQISEYTSGTIFTISNSFKTSTAPGYGLDSTEVDNILIDMSNSNLSNVDILLLGGNAPRTSVSDAAVSNLVSNGCTVSTN